MESFSERLQHVIEARPEISKNAAIHKLPAKSLLYTYLHGTCMPSARILYMLGQIYHVSTSYLLGISDDLSYVDYEDKKYAFTDRFLMLYDDLYDTSKLATDIGITEKRLGQILHEDAVPHTYVLLRIADIFDVHPAYLLGEIDEQLPCPPLDSAIGILIRQKPNVHANTVFHTNLRKAIVERNLTARELSLRIGKSIAYTNTISIRGDYPACRTLVEICSVLRVSADWLFGKTDKMENEALCKNGVFANIKKLPKDRKKLREASIYVGMADCELSDSIRRGSIVTRRLPLLAEALDVSIDYLLGLSNVSHY